MRSIHQIPLLLSTVGTLLLVLILLAAAPAYASSERRSPLTYISLLENAQIHTPSQRIHSGSEFDVTFTLHKGTQEVRLTLEPNNDILPQGAQVEFWDKEGNIVRRESIRRHAISVFKGQSWVRDAQGTGWKNAGWARLVVKRDGDSPLFTGAFLLNHDAHHIQLRSWYLRTRNIADPDLDPSGDEYMVVFRDSDIKSRAAAAQSILGPRGFQEQAPECAAGNLTYNMHNPVFGTPDLTSSSSLLGPFGLDTLFKRQIDIGGGGTAGGVNLRNNIGNTAGCPTTKQLALVGVALDCNYRGEFDTEAAARQHVISQFNSASMVFEQTFNITLGIQTLVVQGEDCPNIPPDTAKWNDPCRNSMTINTRLDRFSEWRAQRSDDNNAFWTLLSTCATNQSVGLAWIGQLCKTTLQPGSLATGANVVIKTPTEWKVIAHEIAHTMGAAHDCDTDGCVRNWDNTSECCPLSRNTCNAGGAYLMNPSTDERIDRFSPCTVGNICGAFARRSVSRTCLTDNRDVQIITENRCGNGIVEAGEECDCGGADGCVNNSCCDPTTCKFTTGSQCDDSNDECCDSCRFAPSTQVCRPSSGECDPEERCTGSSPNCPRDEIKSDGEDCSNGMRCASGQCTSRDEQCQVIMGEEFGRNISDTRSCNARSCTVQCRTNAFSCYGMGQNFLDGTPCQGDGQCRSGQCVGASVLGEVKDWFERNKKLAIGIGAGVGALLLFSITCCCISRCRRRSRAKKYPLPPLAPPVGGNYPMRSYYGDSPPHSQQQPVPYDPVDYYPPPSYNNNYPPPQPQRQNSNFSHNGSNYAGGYATNNNNGFPGAGGQGGQTPGSERPPMGRRESSRTSGGRTRGQESGTVQSPQVMYGQQEYFPRPAERWG